MDSCWLLFRLDLYSCEMVSLEPERPDAAESLGITEDEYGRADAVLNSGIGDK